MKQWVKANAIPAVLVAIILLLVIYALTTWLLNKYWKRNPLDMQTSDSGIRFIKKHEGFRSRTYDDGAGTLTIGYGHTGAAAYPGNVISREEGERLLKKDLENAEKAVQAKAKVKLSQNQFDALVSFAFNTGGNSETVWRMVNGGTSENEFKNWFTTHYITSNGILMGGLVKRRKEEADLYWS